MVRRPGQRLGHVLALALNVSVAGVFAILWLGALIGLATDGRILDDIWAWLSGLEPIAALLAWLLLLPIAVGLWARQAGLDPVLSALVWVGLVLWSVVALSGLVRILRRR